MELASSTDYVFLWSPDEGRFTCAWTMTSKASASDPLAGRLVVKTLLVRPGYSSGKTHHFNGDVFVEQQGLSLIDQAEQPTAATVEQLEVMLALALRRPDSVPPFAEAAAWEQLARAFQNANVGGPGLFFVRQEPEGPYVLLALQGEHLVAQFLAEVGGDAQRGPRLTRVEAK